MAETDAIIRISANGADEASAAIGSVTKSMEAIGTEHNDLVGKFSQRFEHIGLQMFVGEALRANGVGMETRAVVQTLGLALTSVSGAFGAAAMPIFLTVAALTAVAGIASKVIDHHKNQADSLAKLTDAEEKERISLQDSITALQKYVDANGPYAEVVGRVLDAKIRLQSFIEATELVNLQKQIDATKQAMLAEIDEIRSMELAESAQKSLTATKILALAISQGLVGGVVAIVSKYTDYQKKIDEVHKSLLQHNVDLADLEAKYKLGAGGIDALIKSMQESEAEADKESAEFQKAAEEHVKAIQKEADAETARYQLWAKQRAEQIKKHQESTNTEVEIEEQANQHYKTSSENLNKDLFAAGKQMHDKLVGSLGDAVGKMLVEGKNFSDEMKAAFRSMTEQIISDIVRMEIEWAVFSAMSGGGGGFLGGFIGGGRPQAEGGSYLVTSPTTFLAGEAGQPEIATFTPLSKVGAGQTSVDQMGVSQGIQIGTIQTNVYGVDDPDQIADNVARKIVERIRGRGDISFARSA